MSQDPNQSNDQSCVGQPPVYEAETIFNPTKVCFVTMIRSNYYHLA